MTRASSLPVRWQKSSYSADNGGNCVEIGHGLHAVTPVRDSKIPEGPALMVPTAAWSAFVASVKAS